MKALRKQAFMFFAVLILVCVSSAGGADAVNQEPGKGVSLRAGKYTILSYGATGKPPLALGSFVLGNGSYEAFLVGGKSAGKGRYDYSPETHTLKWSSGPYAGVWEGDFTVERQGKTHKIRMKRTTIATNSVE